MKAFDCVLRVDEDPSCDTSVSGLAGDAVGYDVDDVASAVVYE